MRTLLASLLVLAALGCNGSTNAKQIPAVTTPSPAAPSGLFWATAAPGSHSYTLAIVQGASVSGPAVFAGGKPTPCLLAVEVRDEKGALTDDVRVTFRAQQSVLGLGDSMSGWPLSPYAAAEHGRAFSIAEPYVLGTVPVVAEVDAGNGSSNQVVFFVTGL